MGLTSGIYDELAAVRTTIDQSDAYDEIQETAPESHYEQVGAVMPETKVPYSQLTQVTDCQRDGTTGELSVIHEADEEVPQCEKPLSLVHSIDDNPYSKLEPRRAPVPPLPSSKTQYTSLLCEEYNREQPVNYAVNERTTNCDDIQTTK